MPTINEIKSREVADTPVLLFECTLASGEVERWSTHNVSFDSQAYAPRVQRHNLFELRSLSEDGIDGTPKLSLTLENIDSHVSQLERSAGFKGARLTVRFAFFDVATGTATSEAQVVFCGVANAPEELVEATARLSFVNRLSLQRTFLPDVRIQRRCPWVFPATTEQRAVSTSGGAEGKYSPFFRCGYSPDAVDGVGNLDGVSPFASCNYSRSDCEARGMFSVDSSNRITRRFGGIEFVPASILVKSFGEKSQHLSSASSNEGKYNEVAPLVYGTAWLRPPVVFSRSDGNLTHMEVLLASGEVEGVLKVIVNGVEIPVAGDSGSMTATGWYQVISLGNRTGDFDLGFTRPDGTPAGDPYGSFAYMSLVVPKRISEGGSIPRIEVLLQGLKLSRFAADGAYAGDIFSNNPAWVLLDILRRCGWRVAEIDLGSFAQAAANCDVLVDALDLNGNTRQVPRFQCNLVLGKRRSAADVIRGVRTASGLFLRYTLDGKLQVGIESAISIQQPNAITGTNSTQPLNGGWPAYEFGDGTNGFGGILRKSSGEPSVRLWSRSTADSPNRYSVEFQDEFNVYQQDSLSLVDVQDAVATRQEISASLSALGIPNFNQAARVMRAHLNRGLRGNLYAEFETGLRGIGLRPGDLITLSYVKEGFDRDLFRIVRIAPGANYATSVITAQLHKDEWYVGAGNDNGLMGGGIERLSSLGVPRPLIGPFTILETTTGTSDGGYRVTLSTSYLTPPVPGVGGPAMPLVNIIPLVSGTGGTLAGSATFYYMVSALDSEGKESVVSFAVRADTPSGLNTCSVQLRDLSFGTTATAFNVYRGPSPQQVTRIAQNQPLGASFVDTGVADTPAAPPDPDFHHANFYWRMELLPETAVLSWTSMSITNATLGMIPDEYAGRLVRLVDGLGMGQERRVLSNTSSTLTVAAPWTIDPDSTTRFVVSEEGWKLGTVSQASPADFEIPNREGSVVQVCAHAANLQNVESAPELAPFARHLINGGGGLTTDDDVPGAPVFGVSPSGRGSLEIAGIGFDSLQNTRSVQTGTVTLHYLDETAPAVDAALASTTDAEQTSFPLNAAGSAAADEMILTGEEICRVIGSTALAYQVERGALGTTATAHNAGAPIRRLLTRVEVLSFPRAFFGSPASGSYAYRVELPNTKVVAASMFASNALGDSPVRNAPFTAVQYGGLRTLAGGQLSLQVEGHLAIQNGAVPPLTLDASYAVRDVFATVLQAPELVPVVLRLTVNGAEWCSLTIPANQAASNVVSGTALNPLPSSGVLGLDIVSVGATVDSTPGRDLTVTVRL